MAGYFRDRFHEFSPAVKPRVLFLSPYPICPPHHGGAVFMLQTCRELAKLVYLRVLVMVDKPEEIEPHAELKAVCYVRPQQTVHTFGTLDPHSVHEFRQRDAEWLIHREIYLREINVVQYDYLQLAQYRGDYRNIAQFLFEHDVYFQSVATILPQIHGLYARMAARYEYLRSLRYELRTLPLFDGIQYCSKVNAEYVYEHAPALRATGRDDLRAGITAADYTPVFTGRKPYTMLFLGSFRHAPNKDALYWLVNQSLPLILAAEPRARLTVIGSDPPPRYSLPDFGDAIDLRGYADDIMTPLAEHAVFVCPILSGSGIRVKLMESFACGIPVVSTRLGAEGLAESDGEFCRLADSPEAFAQAVLDLFANPNEAEAMARRARHEIETNWDMPTRTARLVQAYQALIGPQR
jgi:glycosyltransferase involved in cell wall biosynthesis